eukprot:361791-Chlamydomonas_euryale.AAC.7
MPPQACSTIPPSGSAKPTICAPLRPCHAGDARAADDACTAAIREMSAMRVECDDAHCCCISSTGTSSGGGSSGGNCDRGVSLPDGDEPWCRVAPLAAGARDARRVDVRLAALLCMRAEARRVRGADALAADDEEAAEALLVDWHQLH